MVDDRAQIHCSNTADVADTFLAIPFSEVPVSTRQTYMTLELSLEVVGII
jgi:hypothetical protein